MGSKLWIESIRLFGCCPIYNTYIYDHPLPDFCKLKFQFVRNGLMKHTKCDTKTFASVSNWQPWIITIVFWHLCAFAQIEQWVTGKCVNNWLTINSSDGVSLSAKLLGCNKKCGPNYFEKQKYRNRERENWEQYAWIPKSVLYQNGPNGQNIALNKLPIV